MCHKTHQPTNQPTKTWNDFKELCEVNGRVENPKKDWNNPDWDWIEYREEPWPTEKTCCHSDFNEAPPSPVITVMKTQQ